MNAPMSKGARKRMNRSLLKAGALILPHEEARVPAMPKEREDRRIHDALARSAAADERCLATIEELPRIREGLAASPIFGGER